MKRNQSKSKIVNYASSSSSDSDDDPDLGEPSNKKILLPNPLKKWPEKKEVIDDPSKHGGRIRCFPHVPGNWSTSVYIKVLNNNGIEDLANEIKDLHPELRKLSLLETDYHISLTHSVGLQYHLIEPFVEAVRSKCKLIKPAVLYFDEIKVFLNDQKVRTFVALTISQGNYNYLRSIVDMLDSVMEEFNFQKYYKKPVFHVSFLWCNGDQRKPIRKLVKKMTSLAQEILQSTINDSVIEVFHLHCKIGDKLFQFDLNG